MKNPVLVLRVTGGLDNKSDLNRFAELSNRWGGLERSGAELAESDARKITDAFLRLYAPDASGNLLAAPNRDFMAAFLKEVSATGLTNAERNTLAAEETPVTPDPTSAEARFSVTIAQARREYDDVISRFMNPDGTKKRDWMKAPNGKPTNLTERQWVQVRTP